MMGFLDGVNQVLGWIGTGMTIVGVISFCLVLYGWFMGILPAVIRLGNGLSKRKIAIFAEGENLIVLKSLLLGSKLFKQNNIIEIGSQKILEDAKQATIYLISWKDYQSTIDGIIEKKEPGTAVVVYAAPGSIPPARMEFLDSKPGVVVANFRGRMLNDILVCLMTTGYTSA
jgi:hypothetical protein